ncbi:2,3,4,5-tetrahydropyridine-2,6-dicarboxylate N-succinyltransferase [Serratia symbiotica]|nr:2,3,4,5-tetrahydropyridine-2,6-dicarboxylate N-succinyltransferase [Serratia symbiotica]
MKKLQNIINDAYNNCEQITPKNINILTRKTIIKVINLLDKGILRVAEKINNIWITHEWLKKSILLYFRINNNKIIKSMGTKCYDKIPMKFSHYNKNDFQKLGCRIVPPNNIRQGAFIAHNTILMPSFINIGAYIDTGTMIDTWVTVGSCAQIGKNVHLSGGVGIGGVLEPLQTNPTIIEDNCFIGARSEIVEGVIIKKGSVISMGVYIGQSTRIFNRITNETHYGYIPSGSVVVPGSMPSKNGSYNLYCAIIVKKVDSKTRNKISINKLLRTINE